MLRLAIMFLVIAILAALFGFGLVADMRLRQDPVLYLYRAGGTVIPWGGLPRPRGIAAYASKGVANGPTERVFTTIANAGHRALAGVRAGDRPHLRDGLCGLNFDFLGPRTTLLNRASLDRNCRGLAVLGSGRADPVRAGNSLHIHVGPRGHRPAAARSQPRAVSPRDRDGRAADADRHRLCCFQPGREPG